MGYIGEIFEITEVSVSASPAVYGASVTVSYKLKNVCGTKIVKLGASVNVNEESFDPARSGGIGIVIDGHEGLGNSLSFLHGATKSFSYTFVFGNSAIAALFSMYPNVRAVPFELDFVAEDANGWGIGGKVAVGSVLGMRYLPSVPALSARRDPTEESDGAAVTVRCALAEGANPLYPGLALTLQWRERGEAQFPGANQMAVDVEDALSAIGATVYPSDVFEPGQEYALRATFSDGIDAAFSETILAKSFAVFDISPDGYGFAVGQYATGTEEEPKFECQYLAYFYGGIKNLAQALGIQSGDAGFPAQNGAKANAYTDVAVSFPAPYKEAPLLFLSVKTGSTAVNMGSHLYALLTDSLTASGFTVRWFNNTATDRWPTIRWTALGEPGDSA